MLKARLSYSGKCPRHPRFDPVKDGRGGVRAGCLVCDSLCGVAEAIATVHARIERADAKITDARAIATETARRRELRAHPAALRIA
jgi:hypothetical protein